jgi:ribosome-binding ATPase YchF (GTP1/OBG family)
VGEDEVRAWQTRRNSSAPAAGGAIHSDIERGFIRAEHMRYEDLLRLGSENAVKEAGKWSLKGKDYIVQEGDILNFRFNV